MVFQGRGMSLFLPFSAPLVTGQFSQHCSHGWTEFLGLQEFSAQKSSVRPFSSSCLLQRLGSLQPLQHSRFTGTKSSRLGQCLLPNMSWAAVSSASS